LGRGYAQKNPEWVKELELMIKTKEKAEIRTPPLQNTSGSRLPGRLLTFAGVGSIGPRWSPQRR